MCIVDHNFLNKPLINRLCFTQCQHKFTYLAGYERFSQTERSPVKCMVENMALIKIYNISADVSNKFTYLAAYESFSQTICSHCA